jgi:hypothetical protein
MADGKKKATYELDVVPDGFLGGLQKAAGGLRGFAGDADSSFKKVQDAFGAVQKQLLVLAGIVAGGAFFKDAMNASIGLTGETVKLQKALGITGDEANTLRGALSDIGSSGDEYVDAFSKFARQLKSNEKGMQALGIQTRDANGNLRDSKELFDDALGSVGQYKAGIDQTTYAQTLFGKSIDEVRTLQKLNNDVLAEAARKNRELGLIVTQENVEAAKKFKLAQNDVGDVLLAVKKTIGDAVMPAFTEMAQYLASTGPYVVEIFKGAMVGLVTVFEVVRGSVKAVAGAIFETINTAMDVGGLIADFLSALIHKDWSGAAEVGKKIGDRIGQGMRNSLSNAADAYQETVDRVSNSMTSIYGDKKGADAPKGGKKRMGEFRDTKDTSRVSDWDAQLAEQKLAYQEQQNAEGSFRQFSKAQEVQFWKEKLAITTAGTAENTAVRKKVAELQLSINADQFAREIAALQTREAAYKNDTASRLDLLAREAEITRQRYGQESKEYEEVQKRIVETKRQAIEQQKQLDMQAADAARTAKLSELAIAQQAAALEHDLHLTDNAQLIAQHAQFEQQRYEITAQGIRDRLELAEKDPDRNPVELARLQQELEQAEQQHQQRMSEIRNQATLESQRYTLQAYDAIQSGWAQTIAKFAQGQLTIAGFFRSMWQNVVQATIGALSQMAAEWLAKTLLAKVLNKTTAAGEIMGNAGVAASGAFAATAAIPYIGPELAPAAAAAAFAGASSYMGVLASASAGYDIPSNVNPLVQAHAEEMILPARQANVIRDLANLREQVGSLGSGGGGGGGNVDVKVHPLPGNFFAVHESEFFKLITRGMRDNKLRMG